MDNTSMLTRILILTLLTFIQLNLYACHCGFIENLQQTQQEDFENSELVFVAEVIKVYESQEYSKEGWFNNVVYELKVTESFKGTTVGKIVKGNALTSCDIYPKENETWLVYANMGMKGMISISGCGLSRSVYEPQRIMYPKYTPEPPPKDYEQDSDFIFNIGIRLAEIRLQAAKDLKEEIIWLRSKQ
ncbi:hypothetical protein [Ekhidna sp. To15]|uniref:hypothetical protein n=1 Tax=Ekhidna sp. To15 TaxID=3395267 RepID=UPI003F52492A